MFRTLAAVAVVCSPLGFSSPSDKQDSEPSAVRTAEQESAAPDGVDTQVAKTARLPVGINLAFLRPKDTSVVFWDVFQQSSRWFPWNGDPTFGIRKQDLRSLRGKPKMRTNENGWPLLAPGQRVFTRMFESTRGRYPGGTYTCTWRGEGEVTFAGDARMGKVRTSRDENGELYTAEVEVNPGRYGIAFVLEASSESDPVRDVRVLLPGHENATSPFYDKFLERIEPFEVIRFMNWGETFTNPGVWSERTLPSDCRQTGSAGVAIEWMVDLCNEADKDAWFCMPHLADDEFVRGFAELVDERLEPGLKVYVEYSNEVWNGIFPQAKWINQQARSRGEKAATIVAEETSRDFAIWTEVLQLAADDPAVGLQDSEAAGGSEEGAPRGRDLIRVIGGALHNPGFARGIMSSMTSEYDAVGVAPYFGVRPGKDPVTRQSTASELLDVSIQNIDEHLLPRVREHARLVEAASRRAGRPVRLVAYEGGQTLLARRSTAPGDTRMAFPEETIKKAQYAQGMYDGYRKLIEGFQSEGLELFVAFHLCGTHDHGSTFGLLEWIDQPIEQSVKYRAVLQDWLD